MPGVHSLSLFRSTAVMMSSAPESTRLHCLSSTRSTFVMCKNRYLTTTRVIKGSTTYNDGLYHKCLYK